MSVLPQIVAISRPQLCILPVYSDLKLEAVVEVLNEMYGDEFYFTAVDGGIHCPRFVTDARLREKVQFVVAFLELAVDKPLEKVV